MGLGRIQGDRVELGDQPAVVGLEVGAEVDPELGGGRGSTVLDDLGTVVVLHRAWLRHRVGAVVPGRKVAFCDAPFCDACGHITVRNGTCYKCLNCGNSMGCS